MASAPHRSVDDAVAQNRDSARTLDYLSRAPRKPAPPLSQPGSNVPERLPTIGWTRHLAIAGAIIVIAVLAFSNSFHTGMTLDNKYIIELDPRTHTSGNLFRPSTWDDGVNHTGWINIWTKDYWWPKGISGLYRPVVTFTYWINWYVLNGDAKHTAGFHVVNLLSHCVTAYLVFLMCLLFIRRFMPAAIAALLFTVHPITVESVTNIIGRADIFAAISVIGGLLLYVRSTATSPWWKLPWLAALFLLTMFGLFSKESAITLMGVVILYDLMYRWRRDENPFPGPLVACGCGFVTAALASVATICLLFAIASPEWTTHQKAIATLCAIMVLFEFVAAGALVIYLSNRTLGWRWIRPWLKYAMPYLAIAIPIALMLLARSAVFAASTPPEEPFLDNPIRGASWLAGRITAFGVTVRLWGVMLWPMNLTADYSFDQVPVFGRFSSTGNDLFCIVATLLVFGTFALAIWMWWKNVNKTAAFFILFFFATYLLTSNIVYTIGAIMAERFMYLPVVAFVALAALALEWAAEKIAVRFRVENDEDRDLPRVAIVSVIAGLIAMGYGVRTFFRNYDWMSDVTLWTAAAPKSPHSFRTYQSLAFAQFEEYQKLPADREALTKNITIDQIIKTAETARPIVDQLPDNYNSSRLYLHLGMYYTIKAERTAEAARPGAMNDIVLRDPESRHYLDLAVASLERAVPIDRAFSVQNRQRELQRGKVSADVPNAGLLQVYEYLGNAYMRLDRPEKAVDAYRYMLLLDPSNPDAYVKLAMFRIGLNSNQYISANPQGAASNAEQACISLLAALWLDPSRMQLWQPLDGLSKQISPDGRSVVSVVNGQPKLDLHQPIAKSMLCSMYQMFVRTFLEAHAAEAAAAFRQAAIDSGFPPSLFDDIYKEFGRTPPPIAPRPAPVPIAAPPVGPAVAPANSPLGSQQQLPATGNAKG